MENKSNSFVKNTGDALERAGEKVSNMGAPKIGTKISQAGDKLEHSQDQKPVSHPTDKEV